MYKTIDGDGAISTMNVTYNNLRIPPLMHPSLVLLGFGLPPGRLQSYSVATLRYALKQQTLRMRERRLGICCCSWRYNSLACYAITTHHRRKRTDFNCKKGSLGLIEKRLFEECSFQPASTNPRSHATALAVRWTSCSAMSAQRPYHLRSFGRPKRGRRAMLFHGNCQE